MVIVVTLQYIQKNLLTPIIYMSFTFKQFHINDEHCAMKVGTDGVLLGAWADVSSANHVLDIGCGSGLISLMLAQRAPSAHVVGIEIDADAANDARGNVALSPFANSVEVITGDALHFSPQCSFDLIVSNPPYHEESLLPPSALRAKARHTSGGGLTFSALLETATRLLNKEAEHARFSVVLPTQAVQRFTTLAAIYGLNLCRETKVVTRPNKPCKRTLLEFTPHATDASTSTLVLLDEHGKRSNDYNLLCSNFYL